MMAAIGAARTTPASQAGITSRATSGMTLSGTSIPGKIGLAKTPIKRSEEHTSELQSRFDLVCRLLLEKKKSFNNYHMNELHKLHADEHASVDIHSETLTLT